jgi:xanthine dehydrogenase accessory factor
MEALDAREAVAMATAIEVNGASPCQPGFKLVVWPDGRAAGNMGGGGLEERVRQDAVAALRSGQSGRAHYSLLETGPDAVGALCGGEVTVFLEVFQPAPILLILGGGHVGRALADLGGIVGFGVQIVDTKAERAAGPMLEPATVTDRTYAVIMTDGPDTDEQALRSLISTPAAYIGMIGSRRKVEIILRRLRADGVPEDRLTKVRAPIGLDLGGRSPAEIALAILAEIVQMRYGGTGRPRGLTREAG